jgi:3-isopropylmalate dehydrogenase
MTSTPTVAVLKGDGIGPEVLDSALSILGSCLPVHLLEAPIGGDAIAGSGGPLPDETIQKCRTADAVLLGAVGGPRWPPSMSPAEGLLRLRRRLGLYANLRPVRHLNLPTPLREGLARHADVLIVRDLAGGLYLGEPRSGTPQESINTWRQTTDQVRRVAHVAFRQAAKRRNRVTSVDKADLLEAGRLWRSVVDEVAREYPSVHVEHRHADAMTFELLQAPSRFDVILADSLIGDILGDGAALIAGAIGVLASASIGDGPALYKPVHGAAPDLAGRGSANPTGAILAVSMLLEHSLGRPDLARIVESAVNVTLRDVKTPDIGGKATTREFTEAVHRNLSWLRWTHTPAEDETEATASSEWGV